MKFPMFSLFWHFFRKNRRFPILYLHKAAKAEIEWRRLLKYIRRVTPIYDRFKMDPTEAAKVKGKYAYIKTGRHYEGGINDDLINPPE
ncbi:MAG TPA: hypothetical protein VMW92_06000 [Candidatus Heimdallarchaeota archaeon]|nr:hypothetical protein [Candidatus Heimdallarchaeota archaeon]